jgi:hypothetical protein
LSGQSEAANGQLKETVMSGYAKSKSQNYRAAV